MNVALWSYSFLDLVEDAMKRAARGQREQIRFVRVEPDDAAASLLTGTSDIALVPTTTVLINTDAFDVLPAFALSTWNYPLAQVSLPRGLSQIPETMVTGHGVSQEAFVAAVTLKEHYGVSVALAIDDGHGRADISSLTVSERYAVPDGALDVGREWYELANYPMVWGVLAVRKGEADIVWMRIARDAAAISDRKRSEWATGRPSEQQGFLVDDLRFRMDDLATASVTELTQCLFYFHGSDEIAELPIVHLPDSEEEADENLPLI